MVCVQEVQRSASLMVAAAVRGVLQGAQSAGAAGRARAVTGSECGDASGSDASGDELADGISSAVCAVQDLSASLVSAAAGDGAEQSHAPRQRGRRRALRRGAGEPAGGVLEQVLPVLMQVFCACMATGQQMCQQNSLQGWCWIMLTHRWIIIAVTWCSMAGRCWRR